MPQSARNLGLTERTLTALSLLILIQLLAVSGWLWRWDLAFYDLQLRQWSKPPAQDIVIVAVDEQSLTELGRWPWPRDRHARLIDILTDAGAKAIALDILFAEADRNNSGGDTQLIQSVAASGRVFLPVVLEEYRLGGQLVESRPMPALAKVAAGLGHMHMELDADGIARGLYLYEGLGEAFWPHLMLTLQQWLDPDGWPLQPRKSPVSVDDHTIKRHSYRLIPFSGPPGHYPRYSYSKVLKRQVPADVFKDRIVLVGVTATGLGDVLPTPVSAHGKPMPGVEINANILDLLRTGKTISRIGDLAYYMVTGFLVLLPFLLYPYFSTRLAPLVPLLLTLLLVMLTLLLLRRFQIWYPPSAALMGLLLSYPLWSWRRLEQTVAYLKLELGKLDQEQRALAVARKPVEFPSVLEFLQQLMPVQDWLVIDRQGRRLYQGGEPMAPPPSGLTPGRWWRDGDELWTEIPHFDNVWRLGLRWPRTEVPQGRGLELLEDFAVQLSQTKEVESSSTLEQVERRILQVQQAQARLSEMRRFMHTALDQMDDGLLVVDSLGRLILANQRAAAYLGQSAQADMIGQDALGLLETVEIVGNLHWRDVIRRLLVNGQPIRFEAQGVGQRELYVQLQPLDKSGAGMHGIIINLSDIGTLKQSERTRARMLNFLSHDIRSPITSLLSLTHSRLVSEGTAQELAEQIRPLAYRSLKLADDFLQQARAEAADATSFSDTDFVSVIHNAMGDIYAQAQQREIRLVTQLEADEVWLQGNVALLERALTNLLSNAIKFSPEGGVVGIHLTRRGERLECCVQDQGPGIAPELREQIFQPFYHDDPKGQTQRTGVGLGLSFVKVVAEKHNGSISLQDGAESGACFCLRLPCEAEEA
jgi:CHASE2 domain-containing sensor protein/signal transduction histidine kinase